ncbi:MAG: type III toxin-antitoxin system ToxN/AbiQ family toxin [Anaeroplasma bactoclasticum]|nr:type III toxin-antitoxin system ToxN/AbiQ family toxin [Anaeroplasma bactoclasticum]
MANSLKLYYVTDEYINFLREDPILTPTVLDSHQEHRNSNRPYVGISLVLNDSNYFIPLSSPKLNNDYFYQNNEYIYRRSNLTIKRLLDASREGQKIVGKLLINNMIPVPTTELAEIDFDKLPQTEVDLLNKEVDLLRRIADDIQNSCHIVYQNKINENDESYWRASPRPAYLNATVDFLVAEQKCLEWIAAKQSKNETFRHLSEQELLETNKKIRYDDADPNELINATFTVDNEEYKIKELELLPGQTKDIALLERTSDGVLFQDNDFASKNPLKLNLSPADKSNHLVTPHALASSISSK